MTALPLTVVLSTPPARPVTNAVKLVTCKFKFSDLPVRLLTRISSRDCPQKVTNGDLTGDAADIGVAAAVAPVAPVA